MLTAYKWGKFTECDWWKARRNDQITSHRCKFSKRQSQFEYCF